MEKCIFFLFALKKCLIGDNINSSCHECCCLESSFCRYENINISTMVISYSKQCHSLQVHRELSTLLGVACGAVESTALQLRLTKERLEDRAEAMAEAHVTAEALVAQAQDIQARLQELKLPRS